MMRQRASGRAGVAPSLWARSGRLEAVRYSTPYRNTSPGGAYGIRSTPTLREAGEMRGGP